MKRIIAVVFLMLQVLTVTIGAEEKKNYLIEIDPTKKIIHVERLGMSANTSIREVLYMMPEVLSRGTENPLEKFSIQVDDKDAGSCKEAVLSQTRIAEVDVIEISISPAVSDQKNGQGGVINIKLKPVSEIGTGGLVMANFATTGSIQPTVLLNYKKNKFSIRTSLIFEHDHMTTNTDSHMNVLEPEKFDLTNMDTISNNYNRETAKIHLYYNPDPYNEMQFVLWESYSGKHENRDRSITKMKDVSSLIQHIRLPIYEKSLFSQLDSTDSRSFLAQGIATYKHIYRKGGEFNAQLSYSINPAHSDVYTIKSDADVPGTRFLMDSIDNTYTRTRIRQLLSEIKSKHLISPADARGELYVTGGVNTDYTASYDTLGYELFGPGRPYNRNEVTDFSTIYISPFSTLEYQDRKWRFQADVRYQYINGTFKKKTSDAIDDYSNHTVTGDLSAQYQLNDHNNLRIMTARNIARHFSDILPLYNVELNYIFNRERNNDMLVTNLCTHYIHADEPEGKCNVFNLNGQLYLEHGVFALAFAGNLYGRSLNVFDAGVQKTNWYYNLNITPIFSLNGQWIISGKITYNSKMHAYNMDLGECFYTQLRVSKSLGHWGFCAELDDVMDYESYDTYYTLNSVEVKKYDMYQRALWLGVEYNF